MPVRIFLSTVSDEFRDYRDQLRHDLTRHNVEVKVQEDFKDLGTVTLSCNFPDGLCIIRQCRIALVTAEEKLGSPLILPAPPTASCSRLLPVPAAADRLGEGRPAGGELGGTPANTSQCR
jgi:hypothetical protein